MPVQIQEMVVKAVVNEKNAAAAGKPAAAPAGEVNKNELIQECVDAVLQLLNNKNQR